MSQCGIYELKGPPANFAAWHGTEELRRGAAEMGDRLRQLFAGASCAKEQRESIRRASLSGRATEPQLPLLGCWAKRIEYLPYKAKAIVLVGLGAACRSLPLEGLFVRTRRTMYHGTGQPLSFSPHRQSDLY